MHRARENELDIARLRSFAGRRVSIRLSDASEHVGTLRTEILSSHSISVFLSCDEGGGATLYIDEIVAIREL